MPIKRKIRVLVIDDSLLFRETIARGLSQDDSLEVVGTAGDPLQARDLIEKLEPDVLTLDVEMPRMSGIEFLHLLMPRRPMPVVVVSSVSANVFDALNAGAVDFVTKPGPGSVNGMENLIRELSVKVKIASTARVGRPAPILKTAADQRPAACKNKAGSLIVIGASTGGTEAVCNILKALPPDMPPIAIVQHMPPIFTRLFAERLDKCCALQVREAADGMPLAAGQAVVAAGELQMTLRSGRDGFLVSSRPGEKRSGHCPSVDVLFESAVPLIRKNCDTIGVLLTGMGQDGAKGLLALRQAGAQTICQDEASSVVYGMPRAAWEMGAAVHQAKLARIPELILSHLRRQD